MGVLLSLFGAPLAFLAASILSVGRFGNAKDAKDAEDAETKKHTKKA
jgi:hypothetical protein